MYAIGGWCQYCVVGVLCRLLVGGVRSGSGGGSGKGGGGGS